MFIKTYSPHFWKRSLLPVLFMVMSFSELWAQTTSLAWRQAAKQAMLQNDSIEAKFQAGLPYEIKDRTTGLYLVQLRPEDLPAQHPLLGASGLSLD